MTYLDVTGLAIGHKRAKNLDHDLWRSTAQSVRKIQASQLFGSFNYILIGG